MNTPILITILGPTASGKTRIAARLAYRLNGEIISADSRQVFREMNIGTGKDYDDYIVENRKIPYHLIDIAEPGTEFNVFQFQNEFIKAYKEIDLRNTLPVLCGGTGLYIEAVLKGYRMLEVPENKDLREKLNNKEMNELVSILSGFRNLHNTTDTMDKNRTIRAIEIEMFNQEHVASREDFPEIKSLNIGIHLDRTLLRSRITQRLEKRFKQGMIDEVEALLKKGIHADKLKFYGLEYKYITMHLQGELSYEEMFSLLNTAIHQFAKRQRTWFRRMEKNGFLIHWVDGAQSEDKVQNEIEKLLKNYSATIVSG